MANLLNIIIPAYNEGENIKSVISEIDSKIATGNQIYIIYDADEDNTLPVVRNLAKTRDNLHLLRNKYGRGFIGAVKTGFENVSDGIVLVVMADGADDLSNVDRMFGLIRDGFDVVCGSRYMRGGKQLGGAKLKKLLSRLAGVSLYYLVGLPTHDATNSFKMYKKDLLPRIKIESQVGFELGLELIVKAFVKGFRITEVPCVWRENTAKKSRFRLGQWLPAYLFWYWYALRNKSPFLTFFRDAR